MKFCVAWFLPAGTHTRRRLPFSHNSRAFTLCSKKSGKSTKKGELTKRKRRRIETYSSYIYKVLKQVHPGEEPRAMHGESRSWPSFDSTVVAYFFTRCP